MNIQTEFLRLQEIAATSQGWDIVETAWMTAMNEEKRGDDWYSKSDSKGDLVVGFAIDPVTKHIILDTNSMDHSWAKNQMIKWLREKHKLSLDDAEYRPVRGWAGQILDFKFPCIFMADHRFMIHEESDPNFLSNLEQSLIDQGIGLPLSSLFMRHYE